MCQIGRRGERKWGGSTDLHLDRARYLGLGLGSFGDKDAECLLMHELRAVLPADRDAQKVAEARVDPLVRLVRLLNLEELKGKLRRTHELAGSLEAKSIACDTRVWYTGVVHGGKCAPGP